MSEREKPLILTVSEIIDLAQFAGLKLDDHDHPIDEDDLETEIVVTECRKDGIADGDGTISYYSKIAYLYDYPEEGICPLGKSQATPLST